MTDERSVLKLLQEKLRPTVGKNSSLSGGIGLRMEG